MSGGESFSLADALTDAEVFTDGDWVESKDQDPDGRVRLTQLADIGDGLWVNKSARFLTSEKAKELKCTFLKPGDLLIARMPDPLGRSCIFPGDSSPCVTVVDVCVVRANPQRIDTKYLMHVVNAPFCRQGIARHATGTTRQRISRKNLGKINILLPPLAEQKRIAKILDAADALRAKRRESLAQLDSLLQSTFLELFGDPVSNPKGWNEFALVDLCEKSDDIRCGPFGTQLQQHEFKKCGVPLWGIKHVNAGFSFQTDEFISAEKAKKLVHYSIEPGDLVMTRKGTIGNSHVYPASFEPGIMHSDLLRLRVCPEKVIPQFLSYQFAYNRRIHRQLRLMSPGAVMPGINVAKLKKLEVELPPMARQQRFGEIIQSIEEQRGRLHWHLDELDYLFSSLQQRAFNGKL
jgi:type I restriction enzyme S subunit